MPESGETLLHFRLVEKIGEGGMGVVWRAHDTTLGRDVAIKILPEAVASDAERLARFEREAKLLASLNHANIASIHGIHQDGATRFLAMELVEGEELTEVVARGVTVERAVEIATEITRALEAAHASGVVHRDLKPGNVKLTADRDVKVLDFGLAKAVSPEAASGSMPANPTLSPTMTSAGTVAGMVLGTAAYMSPEQARGRPVDRRADLWAFGCVLYELLTGRRTFEGETISDTLASVLKESPDWNALPGNTPPSLRRLLRRCLEKDARKRLSDAADARLELQDALRDPDPAEVPATSAVASPAPGRRLLPWLIAGIAVVAAAAGWLQTRNAPADRSLLDLSVTLPEGVRLDDDQASSLDVSRDGQRVVLTGIGDDGRSALYLRRLDESTVVKLPGTDDAENPFFSPDGQWVGFFAGGSIRKVPVAGGNPVEVCDDVGSPRGASWGSDDRIVFPRHFDGGLWHVPGSGGEAQPLVELDASRRERTHRWPQIIPERNVVLFTVGTMDSPEYYGESRIDAYHFDTGKRTAVYEGASFARYVPTGHLVFGRDGTLWAVPFDLDALEARGTPVPVRQQVLGTRASGVVFAALAGNGVLVHARGRPENPLHRLVWRHRDGRREPVAGVPEAGYLGLTLAPDFQRIAAGVRGDATFDLWVFDVRRGASTKLTFDGDTQDAWWTPDGRWLLYQSVRDGIGAAYVKASDGSGEERRLWMVDGNTVGVEGVSHDGRFVALSVYGSDLSDLHILDLTDPDAGAAPFITGPGDELHAQFSPDGRWVAYATNEDGTYEVFVRAADGKGGRWQVSNGGGVLPRWSPDSSRLFYRMGRRLFAVEVDRDADPSAFRAGPPQLWFDDLRRATLVSSYSVGPEGESILVSESITPEIPPDEISVLVYWTDELERLVPTRP